MNAPPPSWQPDPSGRHEYRWWDGSRWTDDVADAGVASTEVPGGPPPGAGPTPPADTAQYPQYDGGGPPPPARRGPPPALIAALAVVAVALVGGLVFFLTRDDGDDSADDETEISDQDSTTTEQDDGDTTLPDDLADDGDDLVEFLADQMVEGSGGVLTHDDAACISEGMLDEFGLERLAELGASGQDPFGDPEMVSQLLDIMEDCDISPSDLAPPTSG